MRYLHQKKDFERFKDEPFGALFWEAGCGKTVTAIDIMEYHMSRKEITAAIVITTTGLVGNWAKKEIPKHYPEPTPALYIWKYTKQMPFGGLIFLVNVDGLISTAFPAFFNMFYKHHRNFMFVFDESTLVKNQKAARTKRALLIAKLARYKFILSGTPVVQSPIDLFSQCEMLGTAMLGHKSIWSFKAKYAITTTMKLGMRSYEKITGYKNLYDLTTRVQKFGSIRKKSECLDLPPKVYRTIEVEFSPEQKKAYTELRARALTYIGEHAISALNTLALINRLLQICCGQIKLGDQYLSIPNNRLALTNDLVDECAGKTVIWTAFVNTAKDLAEELGDKAIWIPSGLTLDKSQAMLAEFQEGDKKAMIANPASYGHGFTLVESSNVIYYSRSANYEHRAQSEDRTHRIGQVNSVLYTDLITPGTVEARYMKLLADKKLLADTVITSEILLELLE